MSVEGRNPVGAALESVLSEILGVSCGNVKFTRESSSQDVLLCDIYLHGVIRCYLEFTTRSPLAHLRIGSIVIITASHVKNTYYAELLKGEETSRIVRAIADELVCG